MQDRSVNRDEPKSPGHENSKPSKPTKGRRAALLLVEAVCGLALLVAAEGVLNVFDLFGRPNVFCLDADGATYRGNEMWKPRYDSRKVSAKRAVFASTKSENTFRVFCVGASSLYGFFFDEAMSLPNRLEDELSERLPNLEIEVINAAIQGIAAVEAEDIVEEAIRHEADAIVLLLGNNEYMEPYLVDCAKRMETPLLWHGERFVESLRLTRIFSYVQSPSKVNLKRDFGQNTKLSDTPWGGGRVNIPMVRELFTRSLDNICDVVAESGVDRDLRLILCTQPVNRTFGPYYSLFSSKTDENAQESWKQAFQSGDEQMKVGDFDGALEHYLKAEAIDSRPAVLQHRMGRVFAKLGDWEEAMARFEDSLEMDDRPVRPKRAVRELINSYRGREGVIVVDLDQAFVDELNHRPFDVTGKYMYDGVHMTPAGNRFAADVIVEAMKIADFPEPRALWAPDRPASVKEHQEDRRALADLKKRKKAWNDTQGVYKHFNSALNRLVLLTKYGGSEKELKEIAEVFAFTDKKNPALPHGKVGKILVAAWQNKVDEAQRYFEQIVSKQDAIDIFREIDHHHPVLIERVEQLGLLEQIPEPH